MEASKRVLKLISLHTITKVLFATFKPVYVEFQLIVNTKHKHKTHSWSSEDIVNPAFGCTDPFTINELECTTELNTIYNFDSFFASFSRFPSISDHLFFRTLGVKSKFCAYITDLYFKIKSILRNTWKKLFLRLL